MQHSESASIGGVGPPSSPQHAAASTHADDFDEHLDRFLYGDGSLVDEAEWYGEVREEEPEAPPFFSGFGVQRSSASQAGGSEYNEPGAPLAAGPPVSDWQLNLLSRGFGWSDRSRPGRIILFSADHHTSPLCMLGSVLSRLLVCVKP